ncbi:MAG: CiaD-like domain-containing protein [Campylobacterota bacterium]
MELKDVILSTLDEIEKSSGGDEQKVQQNQKEAVENFTKPKEQNRPATEESTPAKQEEPQSGHTQPDANPRDTDTVNEHFELNATKDRSEEIKYLENMRERLLVLFEGFQSPNNQNLEAKLDLTINFLEYVLSTLDERLDTLKKH